MKRSLKTRLITAAAVVAMGFAGAAQAHPGTWYWSTDRAETRLQETGIKWPNQPLDKVGVARCEGIGKSIPGANYSRLYKHMHCHVFLADLDFGGYWVIFHVLNRTDWTVTPTTGRSQ